MPAISRSLYAKPLAQLSSVGNAPTIVNGASAIDAIDDTTVPAGPESVDATSYIENNGTGASATGRIWSLTSITIPESEYVYMAIGRAYGGNMGAQAYTFAYQIANATYEAGNVFSSSPGWIAASMGPFVPGEITQAMLNTATLSGHCVEWSQFSPISSGQRLHSIAVELVFAYKNSIRGG